MDDGCRPMGIFARYRELVSGIEKVACFRELDEVICSLRPQYEDGVIEILEIATELRRSDINRGRIFKYL